MLASSGATSTQRQWAFHLNIYAVYVKYDLYKLSLYSFYPADPAPSLHERLRVL